MKDFFEMAFDGKMPIVATAIHDGHLISEELLSLSALDDSVRLREEDPYTGQWIVISDNRVLVHHSRFELDLNRPPERAIYLEPSDAWGLQVWKTKPSAASLEKTMEVYDQFYWKIQEGLASLLEKHRNIVVFDLHSYNYRRNGPDAPPEDDALNPEVNLGTGTLDRDHWANVVDRFMTDLRAYDFSGRKLDVRENIKFKGGYFPRWIHEQFPERVCCLSIEFRKFFMDEWTGIPDFSIIRSIEHALRSTLPGIMEELSIRA